MTEQKIMPNARYGSWGYFLLIVGLAGIIAFLIFINLDDLGNCVCCFTLWPDWFTCLVAMEAEKKSGCL